MMPQPVEFDFDLLATLARESPAEFARRRAELIHQAIATCHHPEEGIRMQSEIDVDRMKTAPGANTCREIADQLSVLVKRMSALVEEIDALPRPVCTTVPASGK